MNVYMYIHRHILCMNHMFIIMYMYMYMFMYIYIYVYMYMYMRMCMYMYTWAYICTFRFLNHRHHLRFSCLCRSKLSCWFSMCCFGYVRIPIIGSWFTHAPLSQMRTMELEYLPTKLGHFGVNLGQYSRTMEHLGFNWQSPCFSFSILQVFTACWYVLGYSNFRFVVVLPALTSPQAFSIIPNLEAMIRSQGKHWHLKDLGQSLVRYEYFNLVRYQW